MKLLYCPTCDTYTVKANFDIATRHPGRLEIQDGAIVAHLGGRSVPEYVPLAQIQRAYCMVCDAQLEIRDVDPCPHESDEQYWIIKAEWPIPARVCSLCRFRQLGHYVEVWD